jgi:argininosuccinate lyase
VALAIERSCTLPRLSIEDYRSISPSFEPDLFAVFNLTAAMEARRAIGAPSPGNVAAQIARWQKELSAD